MNLCMAVMAAGYTVICSGGDNLLKLQFAVIAPFLGKSRLQEATASAAAIVVGFIRRHFDDIFLADNGLDDEPEVVRYRITVTLANDLAGILDGELDAAVLIPV